MIKCLVVDDELLARKLLEDYISKLPGLELVESCKSATEAMKVLEKESIEVMFLDIQMPDISGIDFIKTLKVKPLIILTTAYPEYAIDGYSLDVLDYLLKPISFERFIQSVNKTTEQIKLKRGSETNKEKYIIIKSTHKLNKVNYDDIIYIEGLKEYVSFYIKNQEKIITLESLKKLEEILPDNFMRIHRSYIINKNMVKSLYGNMVEIEGKRIDIGKTYKNKVLEELFK
jgi:DNA-binding LytR/AlgR family response regulator